MGVKVFAEHGSFKLHGDERGFTVPSIQRQEFYKWCGTNGITTEYQASLNGQDLWYIKDKDDRALALLTWS